MFSPRNVSRGVTSGKRLGVARVISLQNSFAKGFSIIGLGILFFAMLMVFFSQKSLAQTQQNPPSFNYQGRLLNATGTAALTGPVDIELQIWDSSGAACLLYVETHQNYDLGSNGLFNFRVGTVVGDAVRGGVISGLADPAIQMQRVYSNTGQARAPGADCAAGYTPTATEGRVMKVITRYPAATGPVAALTPDQYINSVPYAIVAETLQGYSPSDLVKRAGGAANRMQGDLELGDGATNYKVVNLADPGLGTRDAVNQSYADTRYAIKGANNTFTNDIYVNGRIGVGTTSPSADVEIERAGDATFRLYSSLSGGEKTAIQFYGGAGATETASIESANNSNNLFFYTGAAHTQALQLNNTQATFAGGIVTGGSIAATGTIQPGAYSAAGNEPALLTALGLLPTASRQGVMWYESDNDKLRFWSEGVGAKTLATEDYVDGNYVATVTAGTGLNNTGTVGNDIVLNTTFGYGASQSLQGNSTFGDDVSRTATAGTVGLQVDKIQGRTLDFTGLVSGDVLRVDGAGNFVRSNLSDKLSIDGSISMTGTLTTRAGTAAPNTAPIKIPVTSVNGPGGLGEAGSIYFDGSNLSYVDSAGAVNTISVGGAGTYLPLAGGTMTGAISMGGAGGPYKITSLADGTVASDAVNYGQITAIMATNDTNFVRKDGSTALTSNWDLNGVTPGGTILLTGLQDPAVADGAATKGYVDTAITGLNIGNYVLRDGSSTLTATWDVDGAGAGTGKIRGLGTPTNDDDAARKKYVDDSITALGIGNYVLRDGSATMTGNWNFSDGVANRRITNLADPSAAQDAATKNYVDTNFATITNVSTNYLNKDGSTQMDASSGLKFGKYANDAARPAGFVEGQTAYNQTRKTLEVYDGASWVTLSTGGAGAYVTSDGTTPLTGSWDIDGAGAGTGTITGLATPVADADAARKKYVDDSITGLNIGNYVLRDGSATMTGDWNFSDGANNRKITNLANPTAAQDAATKNYVDSQFAGGVGGAIAGDVTGTLSVSSVDKIKGKALDATVGAANNGDFLVYDSAGAGSWKAVAAGTAETDPQVSMTTPLRLSVWNAGGTALVDSPFGVDGSNNLDMNGQKITDLGVPTVSSDAVRKDYVDALFPSQSGGLGVLSGDVSGATNATVVDKIKGKPVNAAASADGQVLIYDQTAGEYFNRTLTGTANQVNVTNGAGTITLGLPQNINTAATPTFSDLTLSSFGAGVVKSDGSGNLSSGTITVSDISDISTNYLPLAGGTMNAGSRITVAAGAAGQQGLKLTAGTNLAAPVAGDSGSIEYNGTSISYIDSTGARQTLSTAVAGGYLPLAGGTMTGAINAGGFAMTNLADPTGAQDAATKNYVDTNFTNNTGLGNTYVKRDGSSTLTAAWDIDGAGAGTGTIRGLATPTNDDDAARKKYVDDSITGLGIGNYVLRDGTSTLTADWDIDGAGAGTRKIVGLDTPTQSDGASTKGYVDSLFAGGTGGSIAGDVTGTLSASTVGKIQGVTVDSTAPTDAKFLVYDGVTDNRYEAVALSGDATMSNTGALTLKNTGTAGTYTKVTTDAQGRITSGSNLVAGDIPDLSATYLPLAGGTMNAGSRITVAAGAAGQQGLKLTAGTNLAAPVAGDSGSIEYDGTSVSYIDSTGARRTIATSATAGETNDGANVGTGVGIFKDKSGVNLRFKSLQAASTKLSVAANGSGNEVDIDVNEANLTLGNIGGILPLSKGGTEKNLTAANGGIVWTDADSMEVSAAGTSGQILRSNGAAAPTWVDISTLEHALTSNNVIPKGNGTTQVASNLTDDGSLVTSAVPVRVNNGATSGGEVRFGEDSDNGTNYVALKAPDILAGDTTYTLPTAYPVANGYALTSQTDGTLAWTNIAAGVGDITDVTVSGNGISVANSSGPAPDISLNNELQALSQLSTTGFVKRTGAATYSTSASVSLTADISGVLPLANGGTNKNMTAQNGGIVWTDADSMEVIAAGTAGYALTSGGAGAPAWTDLSAIYVKRDGSTGMTADWNIDSVAGAGKPKIQGLADGSASDDAAAFGQIAAAITANNANYVHKDGSTQMTGGLKIGTWATAGRPSGGALVPGVTGFNTDTGFLESYTGSGWVDYSNGAGAGGITTIDGSSGTNLSVTDDTNVTMTGGANNLTLGWSGQLAVSRGGTGVSTTSGAAQVFAGPSGAAGAPSFRTLVAADLPAGTTSGAGTTNALTKYTDGANAVIGNSNLSDSGTLVTSSVPVRINNGSTSGGEVRLGEDSDFGTEYVALRAPTTDVGSSVTWTLPAADSSGTQALVSNGSGQLSWQSLSSGSVTSVSASAPLESSGGATPTISFVDGSATGKMLRSVNAAEPAWSTATFADTYGASQLLFSNGANNVVGLATANSATLQTNGSGVPSLVANNTALNNMLPTQATNGGKFLQTDGTNTSWVTALTSYTETDPTTLKATGAIPRGNAGGTAQEASNLTDASGLVTSAVPVRVNNGATSGGSIRLGEDSDNGTNFVAIKSPDTLAGDVTYTLPATVGTAGYALTTDGTTGQLSWTNVTAGSISGLTTNYIPYATSATTLADSKLLTTAQGFAVVTNNDGDYPIALMTNSGGKRQFIAFGSGSTAYSEVGGYGDGDLQLKTLGNLPIRFYTSNTERLSMPGDGGLQFNAISTSGVSAANNAKIYYDTEDNKLKVSYNGAAYTDLVPAGAGGDLTEVQVGTGLTVTSGTGPIPVVNLDAELAGIEALTSAGYTKRGAGAGSFSSVATIPVGDGGTGLTSGTSGGIPYYSAANTMASSAALTQYGVVLGGGAGASPTSTAAGSNGQFFVGVTGANPAFVTMSGDATTTNAGVVTVNNLTHDLAMGSHKITGLTDGSASSDAAAFGQIAAAITANNANYVTKDGLTGMTADWNIDGIAGAGKPKITGLDDPTAADGAATKNYVDTQFITKTLPAAPGAGQNAQSIRWNNGSGAWEYFTPGVAGSGVNSLGAGNGLANSGTATDPILDVNVDNSTVELNGDALRVKALGITNSHIANSTIDLTAKVTGVLPVANGGTGASTLTDRGLVVGRGTAAVESTGSGSAGQIIRSGGAGANPAWSTATYPATATTAGTFLRADGTNWVASGITLPNSTTANRLLFSSAANTVGEIAVGTNNQVLKGVTGGAPVFGALVSADLPSGTASGTGTTNAIPKYTNGGSAVIGDSNLSDSGTLVTSSVPAQINNTGAAGTGGELRLRETSVGGNTQYVGFRAPDSLAANNIYVMPNAFPGSNQYLMSDASGNLSWSSPAGAGDLTEVQVGTGLTVTNGTGPIPTVSLGTELAAINGLATTGFVKRTGAGAYSTSSSIDLSADVGATVLPLANGGTSKALTAANGGIVWTDANSMEVLAAGTAGYALTSGGAGSPAWTDLSTIYVKRDGSSSMSGDWDLNGATAGGTIKITGLADPTASDGAVNKGYADTTYAASASLASYVKRDGTTALTGNWDVGNYYLTNLASTRIGSAGAPSASIHISKSVNTGNSLDPGILVTNTSTATHSNAGVTVQGNNGTVSGALLADGLGTSNVIGGTSTGVALGTETSHPLVFYTALAERLKVDADGGLQFTNLSTSSVSESGKAKIYYDTEDNKLKVSYNGAAYADLAGASGGGVTTMTAVGSSPNANGATISGTDLTLQPADATNPGVVTAGTQTIAGAKTFNSQLTVSSTTVPQQIVTASSGNVRLDLRRPAGTDVTQLLFGTAAATDYQIGEFADNKLQIRSVATPANGITLDGSNGSVGIGTISPVHPLDVTTATGYSTMRLKNTISATNVGFSVLPWSGAVYLAAGARLDNTTWVLDNTASNNSQLLVMQPGTGVRWYASDSATPNGNWTIASNVGLWNAAGAWVGPIASSSMSGTTTYIPKFTTANTVGNSSISDNGSVVNIANLYFNVGNKRVVDANDSWLRLNQAADFTSGTHIPYNLNAGANGGVTVGGNYYAPGNGILHVQNQIMTTGGGGASTDVLIGTAVSNASLVTNRGSLGTNQNDSLNLSNIGFKTGNSVSLGVKAIRRSAGADWTSTTLRIGPDVDNSPNIYGAGIRFDLYDGSIKIDRTIAGASATDTDGSIDFSSANAISTSYDCTNSANEISLNGLRSGGVYTLVVTGTGTARCQLNTSVTGIEAATVTYKFQNANAGRIASKHTVYTFMRVGDVVYVSWAPGFN